MNNERKRAEQVVAAVWPGIHLEKRLGRGAYGAVYECVRTDAAAGLTTKEALKIIDMSFEDIDAIAEEVGTTPDSYYQTQKKQAADEIKIMDQLKSPHIVHINDYSVVEKEAMEGFYILIRMDLLTSLADVMKEHTEDTIAEIEELAKKITLDICDALILCQKKNVVHRDIKPQNVFMSDNGEFYLGDFGVAKSLSGAMGNLSYKGTEYYIAPEVAQGKYDHRVDLYSLGLLLYQLLNHRRLPFCPAYPRPMSVEDSQSAYIKRVVAKEPIPAPDNCSPAFAKIVLKLCQYNPDNRYRDAEELKEAILALNQASAAQKAAAPVPENPAASGMPGSFGNTSGDFGSHQAPRQNAGASSDASGAFAGNSAPVADNSNDASKNAEPFMESSGFASENPNPFAGNSGSIMDNADAAQGNSGAFAGSAKLFAQGNRAVPEKASRSVPETPKPLRQPEKKKVPIWAIAAVVTVVIIAAAMILGKTVFAPKDGSGASLSHSDGSDEPGNSGSPAASNHSGEGVKLTSLSMVESESAEIRTDVANSLGETFSEAVFLLGWHNDPYVRFYVRDYDRLVGFFSCPDEGVTSGETFTLAVYLDDDADSPVLTADMSRTIASTPLDIDLTGADFITFQLKDRSSYYPGLLLTDCFLYGDGSQADAAGGNDSGRSQADGTADIPLGPDSVKLTSLNMVEGESAEIKTDVANSLGETFSDAVFLLGWHNDSYVRFYVRDYDRLVGFFSCPDEGVTSGETFTLAVYLDDDADSPVLTADMSRTIASTPLDIDLTGADFITFQLKDRSSYYPGLLLTDCYLTK